jgi:hypothetical protein
LISDQGTAVTGALAMAGEVEDDNLRPSPPYRPEGPPQIVTADTARQGPLGKRALVVLLVSLATIAVGWVVVAYFIPH